MKPIYLWMHVGCLGGYREILDELFDQIESSGLREAASQIFVSIGGETDYQFPSFVEVVSRLPDCSRGENPTLENLWKWALDQPDDNGLIFYCHTKGASKPGNPYSERWRHYLAHYLLDLWRVNVAALESDFDCCGVDWFPGNYDPLIERVWGLKPKLKGHYSGNFWSTSLRYIRALPASEVSLTGDRFDSEYNFLSAGSPRAKCLQFSARYLYHEFPPAWD